MKKVLSALFLICVAFLSFSCPVVAQENDIPVTEDTQVASPSSEATAEATLSATTIPEQPPREFEVGVVLEVLEEQSFEFEDKTVYVQRLLVRNSTTGEVSEVQVGNEFQPILYEQRFAVGDKVILSAQTDTEGNQFTVLVDTYRLPALLFLLAIFFTLVAVVGGVRGMLSIAGMLSTFGILGWYMLPAILNGANPVLVSVIASTIAGAVTIYLAHGFNRKSHVAFGSIATVLVVVILLSTYVVKLARLLGLGDEQAYFLQFAEYGSINLQGLFLAGIIIGALGVLDDIIVAQVSVVEQLLGVNTKIPKQELYFRALEVGKDHVASLVNTLVLAYAGTSLPLFLLIFVDTGVPLWVKINDQVIAEEVVRTLTGSIGLILAVPLTTLLAVYLLSPKEAKKHIANQKITGHHHH